MPPRLPDSRSRGSWFTLNRAERALHQPGAPDAESGDPPPVQSNRAQREQQAYDHSRLWERSHRAHVRFLHVFQSPNTRRADRRFEALLREAAAGRRVLEIGCGDGSQCASARASGASYVLGLEVSARFLSMAQVHAEPGRVEFARHDVERPLAGRFDVIVGTAVLHHVDYQSVVRRLYEDNLAEGGLMLFREPLGENLLVRLWWWWGTAAHSPDERPFRRRDLAWFRQHFPTFRLHGVNYLSLPAGVLSSLLCASPDHLLLRLCDRADDWLDRRWRWLVPRFRYAIMVIRKPAAGGPPAR